MQVDITLKFVLFFATALNMPEIDHKQGGEWLPIFRATNKSAFITNAQSRFAPVVHVNILGPLRLARHTPDVTLLVSL